MRFLYIISGILLFVSCSNTGGKELNIQAGTLHEQTNHYSYTLAVPHITNNNTIKKEVQHVVNNEVSKFIQNAYAWCNRNVDNPGVPTAMEGHYTIMENSPRWFAVRWTIYVQWSGSQLPSNYFATLNYDRRKDKLVDIKTFAQRHFAGDSAAARAIAREIARRMDNPREFYCNSIWHDAHPIEDFTYMSRENDDVVFIFDDYILETSTCGTPEVRIPVHSLIKSQ